MSNNRNTTLIQDETLSRFAGLFKALANPNRLRLFLRLLSCCAPDERCAVDSPSACVGELGADMDLAPSPISHHLKELNRVGLIEMRRVGQRIECWIPAEELTALTEFFGQCCTGTVDAALQMTSQDRNRS